MTTPEDGNIDNRELDDEQLGQAAGGSAGDRYVPNCFNAIALSHTQKPKWSPL